MAINDDITISKGEYSVKLFTIASAENFKNALTVIPSAVSPSNQSLGSKEAIVVDILRITHTYQMECYITKSDTKSAKEIKKDLIAIFNGGAIDSSAAILIYEDEYFSVFIEDLVIKKINNDNVVESGYSGYDAAEYHVTITLVEGKLVGA